MITLKNNILAIDTETTGLNPYNSLCYQKTKCFPARPFAVSACNEEGELFYLRWEVNPFNRQVMIPKKCKKTKWLRDILRDPSITKVGHNLGFDIRMFEFSGFEVKGKFHDTLFLMHILTGGSLPSYGLKPLSEKFLDIGQEDQSDLLNSVNKNRREAKKKGWMIATKEVQGPQPNYADYWLGDEKLCRKYAESDALRTMGLFILAYDEVQKNPNMRRVYLRERKLFKVLKRMEDHGVRVFPKDLLRLRQEYTDYMEKHKRMADRHGGKGLNFKSPKQMTHKFYEEKGYEPKFNAKGNYTLDGVKLQELAKTDKLAYAINEYRGASHMITAFLDPYDHFRVKENGVWVLHTNYRQCRPVTGRLSAGDPNLMQVASETTGRRKTEITLRPREAFGPRDGHIIYLPDYSQMEVWVFAFLAQEKAMMDALMAGHDFHGTIGKEVWGHLPEYEKEPSYYRKRAKLLMFCKIYGGGAGKVAFLTDSTVGEAVKFVREYDEKLPGVQRFMKRMIARAQREGKIVNPLGRTYYIDPDYAYKAVNYLIQGTCADIMKNAMINVDRMLRERWKGCNILLTLHDELMIEVPLKYHSKRLMRDIVHEMQRDSKEVGIPIPMPVGVKIVKDRWSKTKEIAL